MAENKMTLKEFYLAVAGVEGIADELKAFAEGEAAKIDARNAARKEKGSKTAQENVPLKANILAYVEENPGKTAKEIAEGVGLTPAKVTALATQMKKDGVLVATEVKVDKRKVLAYAKA